MKRTFNCLDSDAEPYITQKDVVMCRSGIQFYHKSELESFITDDNKPPVDKEWYREYRPANVIVKAKKLFSSLPVTKEHPDVWVNSENWKKLAGGTTDKEVEVVALDGESEGEIGLKTSLTFYDGELYEYYESNKEVSVGYTCKKHFVENPEECGYDIVLDEITEVNHLAITKSGRGGSSVAVIDSLLGGMKPMRTGIFAWLASKMQKDSAPVSFGKTVFDSLKESKGTTEEELASEMKGVMDSCAILKDCEAKDTLLNVVRDCFDHKEKALANEEELTATLDSMYVSISGDSLKEIVSACAKLKGADTTKAEDTVAKDSEGEKKEDETKDSEKKPEDEKKEETKDSEGEKKEDETKDSEKPEDKEEKKEDGCNKDSVPAFATKEDIQAVLDSKLEPMVMEAVKKCLGIKEDSKPSVEGGELDSAIKGADVARDYTDFLE